MNISYRVFFMIVLLALLIFVSSAFAGGWVIITLSGFLEYAVAGKPLALTFTVRQHGKTLLSGLRPTIRATSANGLIINADTKPTANTGEYTAVLPFAQSGEQDF